ncbi:hypothetical protein P872_25000 [Rhodonellum psychrophilum GCM71 = DSM 17998]|uniref:tRNA threonylcarbamoyladenosine biosynthesis protein TsaE n=2 Tax=Rhodonellum TaxID=336827 RepID=U5C302_9BACT|nr:MULTISPECIES: bifunctional tRNA (adenosine(37)-N6)-threonylcarbamoyltransferase complex ATPase subunit type 1 TsaE/phosphotransferase [Rhodonellum]ERM84418.1 hypothetical protein P872_25000 [Rhodonellum psychrophilum GCM71 = DSM 17998]
MKNIYCQDIEDLPEVAKKLVEICKNQPIWVFKGRMGAGKTTLIKAVGEVFGIHELISSPTFSLVNEYQNDLGEIFYHFDFYRIEDPTDILEVGIDEYFFSGHYCWIEWAERIPEYIPESFMLINIETEEEGGRKITIHQIENGKDHG